MKERKTWIDQCRAFGIFIVFLCHSGLFPEDNIVYLGAYCFMPIFYFVSGYLFKEGSSVINSIKRIANRLLIPYFALALLSCGHFYLAIYHHSLKEILSVFYMLLTGRYMWFIPSLICVEAMLILINPILKIAINGTWNTIVKMLMIIVGLVAMAYVKPQDSTYYTPWFWDRALCAFPFYFSGMLYHQYENTKFMNVMITPPYIMLFYCALACQCHNMSVACSFATNQFGNPIVLYFLSLSGIFTLISFFKKVDCGNVVSYIGSNTLVLFAFNNKCIDSVIIAFNLPLFKSIFNFGHIYAIVINIIAISMACVIAIIINRYFPELAGIKRIKR